jgi:hypothetical protein
MRVDILPVCSRRTKDDANRRKASGREREGGRGRRRETERECVGIERECVCVRERERIDGKPLKKKKRKKKKKKKKKRESRVSSRLMGNAKRECRQEQTLQAVETYIYKHSPRTKETHQSRKEGRQRRVQGYHCACYYNCFCC